MPCPNNDLWYKSLSKPMELTHVGVVSSDVVEVEESRYALLDVVVVTVVMGGVVVSVDMLSKNSILLLTRELRLDDDARACVSALLSRPK